MYILLQNYKKTDMRALSLCFFFSKEPYDKYGFR